jgi:hypothetical protein
MASLPSTPTEMARPTKTSGAVAPDFRYRAAMLLIGEPDLELKADTAHGLARTIGDNDTVAVNIFE